MFEYVVMEEKSIYKFICTFYICPYKYMRIVYIMVQTCVNV